MFVDASALTAILASEPDAAELLTRMRRHETRSASPLVVWETTVALARIRRIAPEIAAESVEDFLREMEIEIVDLPAGARSFAMEAHIKYGKGRHPAALNFGDCFAYACAKLARVPMLYKGADFALTDIAPA